MIGDLYHRWVFPLVARLTSIVTDSTSFPFCDVFLGAGLFVHELLILWVVIALWQPPRPSDLLGALVILAIAMLTYGLNFLRSRLMTRMRIVPEDIHRDRELQYAIERLNELSPSKELSFQEKNDLINLALDQFVLRTESYHVPHAQKTKFSTFSKHLLRRRIGGLMCPFFQEIIVSSELFPEDIAHEKAHLVGYARESEAQFVGFASMLHSTEPIQYLAYAQRLDLLIRMFDLSMDEIEAKGLNQRTLTEMRRRRLMLEQAFAQNSRYRKLLIRAGQEIRSLMLRAFGEGNCKDAYVNTPLSMISAYDPPK